MIPLELMAAKIKEAASARRNKEFLIIGRTNAMRASTFEFRNRFWIFAIIYWLGFLLYAVDHQSLINANLLGFGDKFIASLIEAQEKLAGVKIVPR